NANWYVFELGDFILLAAMTPAITLTLRAKRKGNKTVDPAQQVKDRAKDRLTMVKMPSNNEGATDE
ncbi:NADH-quinone oxidoreductase subunit J, partial [Francisella tularensis subsp. holarctica]|nr:NADH-quinone oxidoreductase subunit J [Francisella tularensis subsp. holarctica]